MRDDGRDITARGQADQDNLEREKRDVVGRDMRQDNREEREKKSRDSVGRTTLSLELSQSSLKCTEVHSLML